MNIHDKEFIGTVYKYSYTLQWHFKRAEKKIFHMNINILFTYLFFVQADY